MFDYESFLFEKLQKINLDLGLGLEINVANEQSFIKPKYFNSNSIYAVIRMLSADLVFEDIKTQPIQITILSAENNLVNTQTLFNTFVETYNQNAEKRNDVFVRQIYSTPIVMTNFEEVGIGYRSLLYVNCTLFISEKTLDLTNLTIDGESFKVANFSLQYSAQSNTQPVGENNLSESVKNTSTLSLSISMPLIDKIAISKALEIAWGVRSGNDKFEIGFNFGTKVFEPKMFLVISITINWDITGLPSLQIGVML